jgi:hypothetical protein
MRSSAEYTVFFATPPEQAHMVMRHPMISRIVIVLFICKTPVVGRQNPKIL